MASDRVEAVAISGETFGPDLAGTENISLLPVCRVNLGLEISPKLFPVKTQLKDLSDLSPNQVYRRRDLHGAFKGQRQGGISTPKAFPIVMLFSGDEGAQYGYADEWSDDRQIFRYTGEGQKGDMKMQAGNLAIKEHALRGKRLLVFSKAKAPASVQFQGDFEYVDFEWIEAPDVDGNLRKAIRFILKRLNEIAETQPPNREKRLLRKPSLTERTGLVTSRVGQGYYRQEVITKFGRKCAVTGSDLIDILIAGHIVPWRDANESERLEIGNAILLSPLYDALFDRHLISFEDDGKIIFSSQLKNRDDLVTCLRIDQAATIAVTEDMKPYLQRHREKLK